MKDAFGREFLLDNMKNCVGAGWASLIEHLYAICEKHNVPVFQVKEKFGTLRFYIGAAPTEVLDEIDKAESLSSTICEVCGERGALISNRGWIQTRCEKHSGDSPKNN